MAFEQDPEPEEEIIATLAQRWEVRWSKMREWLGLGLLFVEPGERLLAKYSEPGRFYHDAGHVLSCLQALDHYPGNIRDNDVVELALWYHDAVYDAKAGARENEEQSAQWFRRDFQDHARDLIDMDEVHRLILATCHDGEPSDEDEALIMDLDLGILGAAPPRYDAYADGIRKEYAHVDEENFRQGRSKVLKSFLHRRSIFWTRHFSKTIENQARQNLARELQALQA